MKPWLVAALVLTSLRAEADAEREARSWFEAGDAAYQRGDFARSIELFQKSYQRFPLPLTLFDIAQSYRRSGQSAEAVRYYRQYLALQPGGRLSEIAERKIRELDVPAAHEEAPRPVETPRPVEPTPRVEAAPPSVLEVSPRPVAPLAVVAPKPKPTYRRWWPWTLASGLIVVGAAVGIAVAVTSSGSHFSPTMPPIGPRADGP